MSGPGDKRRFARVVPYEGRPVEVQLMGTNFLEVVLAADISEGGIGICADHAFNGYDLNHEVEVVISLPGKKAFLASGRLRSKSVRGNRHVFGVEFTHVDANGREPLAEYVRMMMLVGRGC